MIYLDAASNQVGDGVLTAALQPVKDEGAVLLHLHRRQNVIKDDEPDLLVNI